MTALEKYQKLEKIRFKFEKLFEELQEPSGQYGPCHASFAVDELMIDYLDDAYDSLSEEDREFLSNRKDDFLNTDTIYAVQGTVSTAQYTSSHCISFHKKESDAKKKLKSLEERHPNRKFLSWEVVPIGLK